MGTQQHASVKMIKKNLQLKKNKFEQQTKKNEKFVFSNLTANSRSNTPNGVARLVCIIDTNNAV